MNQDKLKANKPSNRGLVTRKIFASSQVPPRSLVLPLIFLSLFIFFFYWFYSGLTQQQENLNQINSRLISIEESVLNQNNSCLLYTSPSPRDRYISRMPSSA